jgi:hypothetical protein
MAIYAKKLTLMTEDLQPKITMDLTINKSRFKIGWGGGKASVHDQLGERPTFMIGWEPSQ